MDLASFHLRKVNIVLSDFFVSVTEAILTASKYYVNYLRYVIMLLYVIIHSKNAIYNNIKYNNNMYQV